MKAQKIIDGTKEVADEFGVPLYEIAYRISYRNEIVSCLRSVKVNEEHKLVLLSNKHWEDSYDGYSSVGGDELIDALKDFGDYDIVCQIDNGYLAPSKIKFTDEEGCVDGELICDETYDASPFVQEAKKDPYLLESLNYKYIFATRL